MSRRYKVLTWHVHGSYLYFLGQTGHDFYLPVKPDRANGYGGRSDSVPWPENLREIPAEEVKNTDFDLVLFQSRRNYLEDQYEILNVEQQRNLPKIYLEHDPPREVPTDTKHLVDDANILLVHCTYFNNLMWDNGRTPTRVIEHGVTTPPEVRYTGELDKGIVVLNGMARRGRRAGADIFERVRQEVPLDLVGMEAEQVGGLGEVKHHKLPAFEARYRFFFNPIRYTSMGLAVCEAMMLGMPIIGLATTEMPRIIENNVSGYIDTDVSKIIEKMKELIKDPAEARRLGEGARRRALEKFNIDRFRRDWEAAFELVSGKARKQRREL